MLQVFVLQSTGSKEDDLQLLALRDELCEEADFLWLVFFGMWLHLVKLIRSGCRVTSPEVLSVDGVPVKEQVRDWAVILTKVTNQGGKLRVGQTIVAEPIIVKRERPWLD